MQIRAIVTKQEWDRLMMEANDVHSLQAWEWGEFQKSAGHGIIRLGLYEGARFLAAGSIIIKNLPIGRTYGYCPHGPFLSADSLNSTRIVGKFLELAKGFLSNKMIFLRFEPDRLDDISDLPLKCRRTIDIQPLKTIMCDLTATKEQLLGAMHQKTRYNIRLAEKKGVRVFTDDGERFDEFWELMLATAKRDGFRLHPKNYYKTMLANLADEKDFSKFTMVLYLAEYEKRIIAGNLVSFYRNTATYVHGSSSNDYRNVMAPYLLQWQAMLAAKDAGCLRYDFYGIDENKWPGVTRFKRGFGGKEIIYPGTFDAIYDMKWYTVYRLFRRLRRLI